MNHDEQVRYYDDRYAAGLREQRRQTARFYAGYLRFIRRRLVPSLPSGGRMLDVGCGAGGLLSLFAQRGYETHGVDFSEEAIAQLRAAGEANVSVTDVEDAIPFDGTFDVVTAFEVLEHLYHPERAIERIRNRLAPGGVFLATTPFPGTETDPADFNLKTPDEWKTLLHTAGFGHVTSAAIWFAPLLWRLHPTLNVILRVPPSRSKTVVYVGMA